MTHLVDHLGPLLHRLTDAVGSTLVQVALQCALSMWGGQT